MPFDLIEVRVKSGKGGMPATVRIKARGGGKPSCVVALRASAAAMINAVASDRFNLLIGTGDELGLMRLQRNAGGPIVPRPLKGGAYSFDLGYVPRFGEAERDGEFCDAHAVDPDTLEIILPAWARGGQARNGTIDPSARPKVSNEYVLFSGKSKEVSKRVSTFLAPLAEHFGKPLKKGDLLRIVYGKDSASDPTYYELINTANNQISSLGLAVRKVRSNGTASAMLVATGVAA